jgi:hypothetical protein
MDANASDLGLTATRAGLTDLSAEWADRTAVTLAEAGGQAWQGSRAIRPADPAPAKGTP